MSSYLDVKIELKTWENEFADRNKRKPIADDIKIAPQNIRDAYKLYWKLKNSSQCSGAWGNHVNKCKQVENNVDKKEVTCELDKYTEKIAKIKLIKQSVSSSLKKSNLKDISKEENTNDSLLNTNIKINTSKPKSFNFKCINSFSVSNFSTRDIKVNNDWLNRCNDTRETSICEDVNKQEEEITCNLKPEDKHLKKLHNKTEVGKPNTELNTEGQFNSCELNIENEEKLKTTNDKIEIEFEKPFTVLEIESQHHNNVISHVSPTKCDANLDKSPTKVKTNVRKRVTSEISPRSVSPKRRKSESSNLQADVVSLKNERKINLLEKKIKSKSLNENFVKLDIRKKKFHRGKKAFSAVKYKRKKWAMKQKYKEMGEESECFRCGQTGHWIKNCPLKNGFAKKDVEPRENEFDEQENEDTTPFLTLDEAAALACGIRPSKTTETSNNNHVSCVLKQKLEYEMTEEEHKIIEADFFDENEISNDNNACIDQVSSPVKKNLNDEMIQNEKGIEYNFNENEILTNRENSFGNSTNNQDESVEPLLNLDENGKITKTPKMVFAALKKFGYSQFRPGQEETVSRILSGLSTLLILSTGAGKSLCYQLPAYLYARKSNCITLVISPLVSLMEDQVTGLPPCLKAVCLHTNLTSAQRKKSCDAISNGKVDILLISPEMAVSGRAGLGFPQDLPPVAFACIDEAHCISEWSHNFRPSYLRLNKILRERFKVKCILALTATATTQTANSIASNLKIFQDSNAIIRGNIIPSNLCLSVSRDNNKDDAVLNLLKGDRFSSSSSIIIYCTRREQTERLATVIRTCLRDNSDSGVNSNAEAYHAGLAAAKRRSVQKGFMMGKLRIVVATVAFGMGLDKADVRSIIHYNMPRRFESYVQEIGRAGRDGKEAHCHLFLDSEGGDLMELRRHIFANVIHRPMLRKLIRNVFPQCKCEKIKHNGKMCQKHEVALPIDEFIQTLDLKEENISTLLCYLELSPSKWVEILNPVYSWCKILCYKGSNQLKSLSKTCPPVAAAIAVDIMDGKNHDKSNVIEFPIVTVASCMGWDSGIVKREIKALEWTQVEGKPRKSGIMTEFSKLSFHFRSPGNFNDDQMDEVLDYLNTYVENQKQSELMQLETAYKSFHSVSKARYWSCDDSYDKEKSDQLKKCLEDYFDGRLDMDDNSIQLPTFDVEKQMKVVQSDIRSFLSIYHEQNFSGISIARIFCGIDSPCFPAKVWGKVRRFWRSHLDVDFNLICKMATQEIIKFK